MRAVEQAPVYNVHMLPHPTQVDTKKHPTPSTPHCYRPSWSTNITYYPHNASNNANASNNIGVTSQTTNNRNSNVIHNGNCIDNRNRSCWNGMGSQRRLTVRHRACRRSGIAQCPGHCGATSIVQQKGPQCNPSAPRRNNQQPGGTNICGNYPSRLPIPTPTWNTNSRVPLWIGTAYYPNNSQLPVRYASPKVWDPERLGAETPGSSNV